MAILRPRSDDEVIYSEGLATTPAFANFDGLIKLSPSLHRLDALATRSNAFDHVSEHTRIYLRCSLTIAGMFLVRRT